MGAEKDGRAAEGRDARARPEGAGGDGDGERERDAETGSREGGKEERKRGEKHKREAGACGSSFRGSRLD
jgi:hypothetical protein